MAFFPLAELLGDGAFPGLSAFLVSETGAVSIMLMYPLPDEEARSGFFSAALLFSLMAICHFVGTGAEVATVLALLFTVLHLAGRFRTRCSRGRSMLRQQIVWYSIESQARMILALSLCVLASAGLLVRSPWLMLPDCVLLAFLYCLLLAAARRGYMVLFGKERQRSLRQAVQGVRDVRSAVSHDESAMMRDLYAKVVGLMESARPFLDEEYSLQDLSMAVYTNKTYLSKTINVMSGKNFRQFINAYRIMYSIEMLKKNPRLRVDELASMSGFHSTVTYTMAFKANMNETPGEYSQRLRSHLV